MEKCIMANIHASPNESHSEKDATFTCTGTAIFYFHEPERIIHFDASEMVWSERFERVSPFCLVRKWEGYLKCHQDLVMFVRECPLTGELSTSRLSGFFTLIRDFEYRTERAVLRPRRLMKLSDAFRPVEDVMVDDEEWS